MTSLDERKQALLAALRVLQSNRAFDRSYEVKSYKDAAASLAKEGRFKYVLFGHTHLAKEAVALPGGALYFNSGTWCNLMQVPKAVIEGHKREALTALSEWLEALRTLKTNPQSFEKWVGYDLTYLEFSRQEDGTVSRPALRSYARKNLA
jgi:hypothetical protein